MPVAPRAAQRNQVSAVIRQDSASIIEERIEAVSMIEGRRKRQRVANELFDGIIASVDEKIRNDSPEGAIEFLVGTMRGVQRSPDTFTKTQIATLAEKYEFVSGYRNLVRDVPVIDDESAGVLFRMFDTLGRPEVRPDATFTALMPLFRRLKKTAEMALREGNLEDATQQAELAWYTYGRIARLNPSKKIPELSEERINLVLDSAVDGYLELGRRARIAGEDMEAYEHYSKARVLAPALPKGEREATGQPAQELYDLLVGRDPSNAAKLNEIAKDVRARHAELSAHGILRSED